MRHVKFTINELLESLQEAVEQGSVDAQKRIDAVEFRCVSMRVAGKTVREITMQPVTVTVFRRDAKDKRRAKR